jgi:transposase
MRGIDCLSWSDGAALDDVPGFAVVGFATQKKSLHASEQDRPDVQSSRRSFLRRVARINPKHLIFVDESGANTAMSRTRARAPRGHRAVGTLPHGHWKTMTLLGALGLKGPVAGVTVDGPTDTEVFRAFVTNALAPALHRGDVVVWDNLSAHKAAGVTRTLTNCGARLLPLPPYSPDLSPIEPEWSKVKQALRSAQARTPEALGQAVAHAFGTITAKDARGWFRKCGYCVH